MPKTRINQEGVYFSNVLRSEFVRTVDGVSTDCGPFDDVLWCGFWHYLMVIKNEDIFYLWLCRRYFLSEKCK